MTLEEIRNELRDLGFEDDSTMSEYEEITLNAINRATWLAYDSVVIPLISYYKRINKVTTTTETIVYFDVDETLGDVTVTKVIVTVSQENKEDSVTTTTTKAVRQDTDVESDETVTTTTEWYPERPAVLTTSSTDDTEIGIPDNLLRPVALLTAHYLWLDDDETKAVYYYNEWETFVSSIMAACNADVKATIVTNGWGW